MAYKPVRSTNAGFKVSQGDEKYFQRLVLKCTID